MSQVVYLGAMVVATATVAFLGNRAARSRRRHGQRVAVIGDLSCQVIVDGVDTVPVWGEAEEVDSSISLVAGGSAGNTGIWMHALSTKLKVRVLDTCGKGGSVFHQIVMDAMYSAGVKVVGPEFPNNWDIGQAVSLTNSEGRKAHVKYPGGNGEFALSDYKFGSIVYPGTVHVHIGGFSNCKKLNDVAAWTCFISRARKSGVKTVSLNPQLSKGLEMSPSGFDVIRKIMGLADFLICNESEAMMLTTGVIDLVAAVMQLSTMCRCVVVTLGAEGALLMRQCIDLRPLRILCKDVLEVPIVDTIGVGDAFGAGFLHEVVSQNLTPEAPAIVEAVRFGCACGTAACTVLGGTTFPGIDMVRACLID